VISVQDYTYIVAVTWLICGGTCAVIAEGKGRNGFGWFLLGTLFNLFALVAVCALPRMERLSKSEDVSALHVKPEPQGKTTQRTRHLAALIAEGEKNAEKFRSAVREKVE
jgi:hypothetical protein